MNTRRDAGEESLLHNVWNFFHAKCSKDIFLFHNYHHRTFSFLPVSTLIFLIVQNLYTLKIKLHSIHYITTQKFHTLQKKKMCLLKQQQQCDRQHSGHILQPRISIQAAKLRWWNVRDVLGSLLGQCRRCVCVCGQRGRASLIFVSQI